MPFKKKSEINTLQELTETEHTKASKLHLMGKAEVKTLRLLAEQVEVKSFPTKKGTSLVALPPKQVHEKLVEYLVQEEEFMKKADIEKLELAIKEITPKPAFRRTGLRVLSDRDVYEFEQPNVFNQMGIEKIVEEKIAEVVIDEAIKGDEEKKSENPNGDAE